MTEIEFWIPGLPVAKGRPIVSTISGHARLRTPAKTVRYEGLVAHAASVAMSGAAPMRAPVMVMVDVRLPVPASWSHKRRLLALDDRVLPTVRPDLDNIVKAVLDGINGVVFEDDALVCDIATQKRYRAEVGVRVIVSVIAGAACAR